MKVLETWLAVMRTSRGHALFTKTRLMEQWTDPVLVRGAGTEPEWLPCPTWWRSQEESAL